MADEQTTTTTADTASTGVAAPDEQTDASDEPTESPAITAARAAVTAAQAAVNNNVAAKATAEQMPQSNPTERKVRTDRLIALISAAKGLRDALAKTQGLLATALETAETDALRAEQDRLMREVYAAEIAAVTLRLQAVLNQFLTENADAIRSFGGVGIVGTFGFDDPNGGPAWKTLVFETPMLAEKRATRAAKANVDGTERRAKGQLDADYRLALASIFGQADATAYAAADEEWERLKTADAIRQDVSLSYVDAKAPVKVQKGTPAEQQAYNDKRHRSNSYDAVRRFLTARHAKGQKADEITSARDKLLTAARAKAAAEV